MAIQCGKASGSLISFRVLDLTDGMESVCGKLLADLGADVVKVEKPGGDSYRKAPPFYKDRYGKERSLGWCFFNANKRCITLDISTDIVPP